VLKKLTYDSTRGKITGLQLSELLRLLDPSMTNKPRGTRVNNLSKKNHKACPCSKYMYSADKLSGGQAFFKESFLVQPSPTQQ